MRKIMFRSLQKLKKGNVLNYIKLFEENYGNYGVIEQNESFIKLLKHSVETTKYYQDYSDFKTLEECPVLIKNTIKENYNDFFSSEYQLENLIPMTTSGSYGTPFTFYLTKQKKEMQHAEVIYFSKWASFDIGVKHGYVAAKIKSKKDQFIQNQISIAPFVITQEWLKSEVFKIKTQKLKVLIGYPSAIGAIAKYMNLTNDQFPLDGVITISEILTEDVRLNVKKAFGVNAISRYSTEELGVLAIECEQNQKHHLNNISYIIEILNIDNDNPVNPGEMGRVIVTDLNSYAMPLIRYDTGDLAILGEGECGCGIKSPFLESLLGRKLEEIYSSDKSAISSMALNGKMRDIEDVLQFQLIQTGEQDYQINLVTIEGFNSEDEIIQRYKELLGNEAKIKMEYMTDIPPLKSGKRPYILQKYYNL